MPRSFKVASAVDTSSSAVASSLERVSTSVDEHTQSDVRVLFGCVGEWVLRTVRPGRRGHERQPAREAYGSSEACIKALETCEKAFTSWLEAGLMSRTTSRKRRRADDRALSAAADFSTWASWQYQTFIQLLFAVLLVPLDVADAQKVKLCALRSLVQCFDTHAPSDGDERDDAMSDTPLTKSFDAHGAVPDLLGEGADADAQASFVTPQLVDTIGASVAVARNAFKDGFVDDFADVRYHTLVCVRTVATAHAASTEAAMPDADVEQLMLADVLGAEKLGASPASAAWACAAGRAHRFAFTADVTRAAVLFLQTVSLPRDVRAWNEEEHEMLVDVPSVVRPRDSRAAASASPDAHTHTRTHTDTTRQTAGAAEDDVPLSAATRARQAGAGAARKRARKVASKLSSADDAAPRVLDRVRARLIDYGDVEDHEEGGEAAKPSHAGDSEDEANADDESLPKCRRLASVRRAFAEAWIAVLRCAARSGGLAGDLLRRVLQFLPTRVLPHFPERLALQLADFLSESYSRGGVLAVLSLEALHMLMTEHGLEYAGFYTSLYNLITHEVVHAKYRKRFFELLDRFMSSSALPAYLVCACVKRTARVCLTSATHVCLWAVPFIYNCVHRHASVAELLHRSKASLGSPAATPWPQPADPFLPDETDPARCRAQESSLWEVAALAQHYFAPVVHTSRVLFREPNKEEFNVSDFSGATYTALGAAELNRSVSVAATPDAEGGKRTQATAPVVFSHVRTARDAALEYVSFD